MHEQQGHLLWMQDDNCVQAVCMFVVPCRDCKMPEMFPAANKTLSMHCFLTPMSSSSSVLSLPSGFVPPTAGVNYPDDMYARIAAQVQQNIQASSSSSAAAQPAVPLCRDCGHSCKVKQTKNGPNIGKEYWCCGKPGYPYCKSSFFGWVDPTEGNKRENGYKSTTSFSATQAQNATNERLSNIETILTAMRTEVNQLRQQLGSINHPTANMNVG